MKLFYIKNMDILIVFSALLILAASAIFLIVFGKNARKYVFLSRKLLRQQVLMAEISRSFLKEADTDMLITQTLQKVGKFMNISQMLFFKLDDDGVTLVCENEWINPKLKLDTRIGSFMSLKGPMLDIIKSLKPDSGKDSCLSSNNPVIKKAMAPYRISFQNYITTPVFIRGEMIGALDFAKEGDGHSWSNSDISLATLFASTLSGVFERETMGYRTSIVENSPIMIFYSDAAGKLVYANPAAVSITGYSLAELYEGGFGLILDEQTLSDVKNIYIPQTVQKKTVRHEVNIICKNGQIRISEVTSFTFKDGMVAAICVDLTEKHALEAEIIKAKERAEYASSAKSEFLSNMSHEMRTPMNAIIGMTRVAKKTEDPVKRNDALNKVEESSKHLLGIINDILDMSKIEANKFELSEIQFDLRNLLKKTVSFVRFRIDEKQLKFSMNIDDNVPSSFLGDDQRLTQVLINLLSNACKFTHEKGVISVNVSLDNEESKICTLRIEVADSGIGISEEQQKKIFNAFEQAENSTTRKYGGTGLGLTISKRIIELMNGEIRVDSVLGKGSKFIFTIRMPRYSDSAESINKKEESFDINNEFLGKKLLLAEDIEINREVLVSVLDGTGLIIDTAENGKDALCKFKEAITPYDVILMDVQMPEMDGLEATRRIRETGSKVPVIAMTANVFKEDVEICLEAGMNAHIGKPVDPEIVFEKLRKYL